MSLSVAEYTRLMERMDKIDAELRWLTSIGAALIGGLGVIQAAMAEETDSPSRAALLNSAATAAMRTAKTIAGDK